MLGGMKKPTLVTMLFMIVIGSFLSVFDIRTVKANSSTIFVDDDNVSGPWDGTPEHPYQNITSGLEHAAVNDTIFVYSGTYYENIHVNMTISLVGEDKHGTIIDGNFTGHVVSITSDNVNITSFTIRNPGQDIPVYWGSSVNASNCNISNIIITNTLQGIRLWNSSDNTIASNQILGNGAGSSGSGVKLVFSSGNTITNNNVSSMVAGIFVVHSDDNTLKANEVYSNWYGIRLQCSSNNTVVANSISDNVRGIYIVSYDLPAINNLIYHNNFVNNTYQATPHTHSNIWDSGYPSGGNHWSDYNGTDLYNGPFQNITGSDGVGDTPYVIDENNTDMYPLINPYTLWNIADINYDFKVDIFDVVLAALAYGATPSDPNWDARADIANPYDLINIFDIVMIVGSYGEEYQ